tara:strand:+ start:379 stop:873 length:495 start_codon:yes stop_codon:yes gene_type:complete
MDILKAINKIVIIDFDQTLFYTPTPEEGKKKYQEVTGEEYPHIGWWSKPESLDTDIFDIPVNKEILSKYRECESDSTCMTVLCTGRVPKVEKEVKALFKEHGINFDREYFAKLQTLRHKLKTFEDLYREYPNAQITAYDDRDDHLPEFQKWAEDKDNVDIVHVK